MLENKVTSLASETILTQHLKPNEIDVLMSHATLSTYPPGDIILQQGHHSAGLYIIIDGSATVSARTLEFEKSNIATLVKGDFIGEVSLLLGEPSNASIIAKTQVRCIFISNVYLDFLTSYFPVIKYKTLLVIANKICYRINETHNNIIKLLDGSGNSVPPILRSMLSSFKKPAIVEMEDANIDIDKIKLKPLFSNFDSNEFDLIVKHARFLRASKNCMLINETEQAAVCYIVIYGGVQSSIIHNNDIAKLSVIGPDTLFCNTANIGKEYTSKIIFSTCENSILLNISEADLNLLRIDHAKIWVKLFDLICKSIIALERSVQKLNIRLQIEFYKR